MLVEFERVGNGLWGPLKKGKGWKREMTEERRASLPVVKVRNSWWESQAQDPFRVRLTSLSLRKELEMDFGGEGSRSLL